MIHLATLFPETAPAHQFAAKLEQRPSLPPLLAGEPYDLDLSALILESKDLLGDGAVNQVMVAAVRSLLLLWNDDFDAGHQVSQDIHSPTGSYLHGICHRREGDRGAGFESNMDNARYWVRRAGDHPVYRKLYGEALALFKMSNRCEKQRAHLEQRDGWDPGAFLDWCQQAVQSGDRYSIEEYEAVQAAEMRLLLQHCSDEALR